MKNKGWIIFGIFVIAAIIAFAIYKASGTTNTSITTTGGSQTKATGGIGELLGGIFGTSSIGGIFSGLFGGDDSDGGFLPGDDYYNTSFGNYE